MEVLWTLEKQVNPSHTALLVVDAQKDYCSPNGAMASIYGNDVSPILQTIPILNSFIGEARRQKILIVYLKELCVVEKVTANYKAIYGDDDKLTIVREGSNGAELYEGVTQPLDGEPVVVKWNYDGFEETELHSILQKHGIKTLLMTGFTTNVCVETTARHGYLKGYYIVLVSDCCSAYEPQEHESSIMNIGRYFGKVATSKEITSLWAKDSH